MNRRTFLSTMGLAVAAPQLACAARSATVGTTPRRLRRVGIQLYTLRDDARRDLEGTLRNIAQIGYKDVELLSSMNNFGMPPQQLRALLDTLGLRAPSTHLGGESFDHLDREIENAKILGHEYLVLASLPTDKPTLDDYRRWADRLNDAGRRAQPSGVRVAFHDESIDFRKIEGLVPYDVLADRTDPNYVRLQLDTGNLAQAGGDPYDYLKRYGSRYWLFHIKDVPAMGADHDTVLGKGVIDFKRLFANIDHIDDKHLYVEQESYPGTPLESVRQDYAYISTLEF
ncbi:MAG TPA: sugar phosphate isomerase/epimerase [Gemmatimonadaceae bacterium]|nr:sugar phosphate isomerase/epimerase [Gemmatimonadaceae bacterium]